MISYLSVLLRRLATERILDARFIPVMQRQGFLTTEISGEMFDVDSHVTRCLYFALMIPPYFQFSRRLATIE